MGLVLAIDPGRRQGKALERLTQEFQDHEVVIATSGDEALAVLDGVVPDLVLFPLFIAPNDENKLQTRLRGQDEEMVNVFMPSTPNPAMGYLMFLPRRDVVVLDMRVEDGIKLVMSGGIVSPDWLREHVPLPPPGIVAARTTTRERRAS